MRHETAASKARLADVAPLRSAVQMRSFVNIPIDMYFEPDWRSYSGCEVFVDGLTRSEEQ